MNEKSKMVKNEEKGIKTKKGKLSPMKKRNGTNQVLHDSGMSKCVSLGKGNLKDRKDRNPLVVLRNTTRKMSHLEAAMKGRE